MAVTASTACAYPKLAAAEPALAALRSQRQSTRNARLQRTRKQSVFVQVRVARQKGQRHKARNAQQIQQHAAPRGASAAASAA
jgi:hypothetical protein